MTGIPDELVRVAGEAIEDAALSLTGRDLGTLHRDEIARAALEAVGLPALLERAQRAETDARQLAAKLADKTDECVAQRVKIGTFRADNEQLRVSVNRDFGEPLDEVYKTDGITIVMQQIHDLRAERDALAAKVADAWDEGHDSGLRNFEVAEDGEFEHNPYRAALTEGTESASEEGPHHVQDTNHDSDQDQHVEDLGRSDLPHHDDTVGPGGVATALPPPVVREPQKRLIAGGLFIASALAEQMRRFK